MIRLEDPQSCIEINKLIFDDLQIFSKKKCIFRNAHKLVF